MKKQTKYLNEHKGLSHNKRGAGSKNLLEQTASVDTAIKETVIYLLKLYDLISVSSEKPTIKQIIKYKNTNFFTQDLKHVYNMGYEFLASFEKHKTKTLKPSFKPSQTITINKNVLCYEKTAKELLEKHNFQPVSLLFTGFCFHVFQNNKQLPLYITKKDISDLKNSLQLLHDNTNIFESSPYSFKQITEIAASEWQENFNSLTYQKNMTNKIKALKQIMKRLTKPKFK